METKRNVTVAMTERTGIRALWRSEGFDPQGKVAMVDEAGDLTGSVDLYGMQEGINYPKLAAEGWVGEVTKNRGSGRAATINGINLKGCGHTLTQGLQKAGGSKTAFYNSGLMQLREGLSEVLASIVHHHLFGSPKAKALVQYQVPNPFGDEVTYGQNAILLREPPKRLESILLPFTTTQDVLTTLRTENAEIDAADDFEFANKLMRKFARRQAELWIRRIMIPNYQASNAALTGEMFDAPIFAVLPDHRDVWCCNGATNRNSIVIAINTLRGWLDATALRDSGTAEEREAKLEVALDVVKEEMALATCSLMGLTAEQVEILQLDEKFNLVTNETLQFLLEDKDAPQTSEIFDSEWYFKPELYSGGTSRSDLLVDAVFNGGEDVAFWPGLAAMWTRLLGELGEADVTGCAERANLLKSFTVTDKVRAILSPVDRGWVAHRHNMAYDRPLDYLQTEIDAFETLVQTHLVNTMK